MPEKSSKPPSGEQGSDASAFFQGYNTLPAELKEYIFELACAFLAPPSSSSTSHPLYDVPACLKLSLVNRDLTERVRPALYRQVSITRPTALYALQQTLKAHPEWGKLIKNLHIGSQSALPTYWWPLSDGYPHGELGSSVHSASEGQSGMWIASSLDKEHLPSGCESREAWALDGPTLSWRDEAIHKALQAAQSSLEIDLLKEGRGEEPLEVEAIYMVQAALDLYLKRARAVEDDNPALLQPQGMLDAGSLYPALIIAPEGEDPHHIVQQKVHTRPEALVVSRAQLLRHLATSGSITDRFDHPLIVARSGYDTSVALPHPKGDPRYREGAGALYEIHDEDGEVYVDDTHWRDEWHLEEDDEFHKIDEGPRKSLNDALRATATLGLNLHLVRAVRCFTPMVKNLSLTGSLQRALRWTSFEPSRVRRATIGPHPPWWPGIPAPDIEDLTQLEELRVAGRKFCSLDRDLIATMRRLRKLESSIGEPWYRHWAESVVENVTSLLNMPLPASSTIQPGAQGGQSSSVDEEDQQASSENRPLAAATSSSPVSNRVSPLTIVRLHTADVNRVLATAPTPEVRDAWLHGRALNGFARRLQLVARNMAARGSEGPALNDTEPAWDVLYQEGRDWWLDGAV